VAKGSSAKQRKHESEADTPRPARTPQKNAAPNLDRLIHERLRLGIISALAVNESLTFSDLKNLMNTTDGNLSVHIKKLEDAGYVSVKKIFVDRKPVSKYKITNKGYKAFENYIKNLESIVKNNFKN